MNADLFVGNTSILSTGILVVTIRITLAERYNRCWRLDDDRLCGSRSRLNHFAGSIVNILASLCVGITEVFCAGDSIVTVDDMLTSIGSFEITVVFGTSIFVITL